MKQAGIVVISDTSPLLYTIAKALEAGGYVVCLTESWSAARVELASRSWDLVIIKTPLSRTQDTQIFKLIKKLQPDTKLVVLSDIELLPVAAFEGDVDDYLLTSLRPADLLRRILICLEKAPPRPVTTPSPTDPPATDQQDLNTVGLMFHDIRGLTVSINSALQLLLRRAAVQDLGPEPLKLLNYAHGKTQELLSLTEEFLHNAFRPKSYGQIEVKHQLIDPVLEELKDDLRRKRLVVKLNACPLSHSGVFLKGDKASLKSMLRNLLLNAIHHGQDNSTVLIELVQHQSKLQIRVANAGTSIPGEYQQHLFAKFSPLTPTTPTKNGKSKGLGLGLYLVREFLQSQGGDIRYEPHHQGSSFIVTLPSNCTDKK
jgi:signal transduction histidine kinase